MKPPVKQHSSLKPDSLSVSVHSESTPSQHQFSHSIIKALDTYPQESLVRILARLFDNITRLNDHLNHNHPSPATPSSQLDPPLHSSTFRKSSSPSSPLLPRPPQSPTVLQFQNLNFRQHQHRKLESQYSSCSSNRQSSNSIEKLFLVNKPEELTTASKEILSDPSSILTFHAKLVPEISVEAYLLRILKYCPTPNGVFLSSLVYLDRLSKTSFFNLNSNRPSKNYLSFSSAPQIKTSPSSECHLNNSNNSLNHHPCDLRFLVDSWNIHRFLIASITVASKLFSDVFYTNARYAKVGGLPLEELEELEMKFLLMSDFRLMIGTEEFESYGRKLLAEDLQHIVDTRKESNKREITKRESLPAKEEEEEDDDDDDHVVGTTMDVHVNKAEKIEERNQDLDDGTIDNFPSTTRCSVDTNGRSSSSHTIPSSSSSSCNSSEHSSCSTLTPHSPTPVLLPFNPPIPASTTA